MFLQSQPSDGFKEFSLGYRLSGVRFLVVYVALVVLSGNSGFKLITYFMVPHHDSNMLKHGTREIAMRGFVMLGVDMRSIAVVVGIPWKMAGSLRRVVNARFMNVTSAC